MKIKNRVINGETKEPLPYASVVLVNMNGEQVGPGYVADDDGYVEIDSTQLDQQGILIQASAAGYDSNIFYPEEWNLPQGFAIYPNKKTVLDNVVVTAKRAAKEVKKPGNTVPAVLMGLALISLTYWAVKTF